MLLFSALRCGAVPGRPVVVEHFSASLRRIRTPERTEHQKTQTPRQSRRRHPHLQTELVASSCMPFHIRVPVLHDLILALELLLVLKAVRVLSFNELSHHGYLLVSNGS